jgi:O-antigen ligase
MAQGFLGASVAGWQAELGRAPGLAGHPNILGLMSGIAIVLCVTEILDRGTWRWPAMVVATVNLGGLLAGGSVSSMIAAAVGLLVLLIAKRASLRIVVAAVAAAIGLGWLTVLAFTGGASTSPVDRVLQVTGQTTGAGTFELRQQTVSYAWEQILRDPWFGVGFDDLSGITPVDGGTLTHMALVRAWFQGGVGLGIAFLMLFVVIACLVVRSLVRAENASAAATLTVVAGFALTAASFQQGYFWLPVLGGLAGYAPLVRRRAVAPKPRRGVAATPVSVSG